MQLQPSTWIMIFPYISYARGQPLTLRIENIWKFLKCHISHDL